MKFEEFRKWFNRHFAYREDDFKNKVGGLKKTE